MRQLKWVDPFAPARSMALSNSGITGVRLPWLWPAIVMLLAGCAGTIDNPFTERSNPKVLQISIRNQGLQDVRVVLASDMGSQTLGIVSGNNDRNVQIPWNRSDRISFRLRRMPGRTYATESIPISPGDHVELIIPIEIIHTVLRRR
jgi:hypothetical protein